MAAFHHRTIEEIPPPWMGPDDPDNRRRVAQMLSLYVRLPGGALPEVRRFPTLEDGNAACAHPYRCAIRADRVTSSSRWGRDD
jgi:hypothetical protein